MLSRMLLHLYAAVMALAGSIVGLGYVGLRTGAGRDVVVRNAVALLNDRIHGDVRVDSIGGSFTGGLEIGGLSVSGDDGTPLFDLPGVSVRYRVRDLLGGRVVLGQLRLDNPTFNLVKYPDGKFNLIDVLGLGGGDGGGRKPLVAFRDVEISDGTIVLRTPLDDDSDPAFEEEVSSEGRVQVRRFETVEATIPYLRLSSPIRGEESIRAEINSISMVVSDPAFDVEVLRGTVEIQGDSLRLELDEFALPDSRSRIRGNVTWPDGPPLFDLQINAPRLATRDLPVDLVPFPDGLTGSGRFRVSSRGPDTLAVSGEDMNLTEANGGSMRGDFGFVFGPDDYWSTRNTSVAFNRFDVNYFRLILDSIPVRGRLSGTLFAHGPHDALAVAVAWRFADERAARVESRITGTGTVSLGVPENFVFHSFVADSADIALATVRLLIPAVELRGRMFGSGELNGAWLEPEFVGTLQHREGTGPVSVLRGPVRLDAVGETVGVWADWTLDSLNIEGIRGTYPDVPLYGAFSGHLSLRGYLDSLSLDAELHGPSGSLAATGVLVFDTLVGAHDLDAVASDLRFKQLRDSLPPTVVTGRLWGEVLRDSVLRLADVSVRLERSTVVGFGVDSASGRFRVVGEVLSVDTLVLWVPDGSVEAGGRFGLDASQNGALQVRLSADSLSRSGPFFTWLLGSPVIGDDRLVGSGHVAAAFSVSGTIDDFDVEGEASAAEFLWGEYFLGGARLRGRWSSDVHDVIRINSRLDTLAVGEMFFSDLALDAAGRRDSLHWFSRARIGLSASILAGGGWRGEGDSVRVPLDSLALLIPSGVWFLEPGAVLAVRDRGVTITDANLVAATGSSRVSLSGRARSDGFSLIDGSMQGLLVQDVLALLQLDTDIGEGVINGTFAAGGALADPDYRVAVAITDGRWRGFVYPDLRGTLDYRDQRLDLDFAIWRLGQPVIDISGSLPLDLGLSGVSRRQVEGPLALEAHATALSVDLAEAMFTSVRDARGFVDGSVVIAGTWDEPLLSGSVSLRDGGAVFPSLRVRHEDLHGTARLSGDTIYVDSLTVRSGDGTARVSGYIYLEGLTRPILALDIDARDFHAVDIRNFLNLTGSAQLHLAGPVMGATLTGSGRVGQGILYFADLLEKNIINLDDPLIAGLIDTSLSNVIREQGLGAAFSTRFLDSLTVDSVRIDMGTNMSMRSQEANIEIEGNLVAGKIGPQYRLDGVLTTPRGTYQLPNIRREFRVTSGEIRYLGTPDLDAEMNISAQHVLRANTGETITIFVNLGGTLYLPQVTLSSDVSPPIPQTEIVSYLISGGPSFGADAAARRWVADVAGALTGELSTLITDLGVPIDFITLRPTSEGSGFSGAELAVGVQLFDSRLFVSASQLACANKRGDLGASVEFRFNQEWRFSFSRDLLHGCDVATSTTVPLNSQLGFDLFWERRY